MVVITVKKRKKNNNISRDNTCLEPLPILTLPTYVVVVAVVAAVVVVVVCVVCCCKVERGLRHEMCPPGMFISKLWRIISGHMSSQNALQMVISVMNKLSYCRPTHNATHCKTELGQKIFQM